MNNLFIIRPDKLKRVKVERNDPYRVVSLYWYYAPILGGMPVNEFILTDGYALINRSGQVPLVGMDHNLFNEITTLLQPPDAEHYVKCCILFVSDEVKKNKALQ